MYKSLLQSILDNLKSCFVRYYNKTLFDCADMSSTAFIEPLPVIDFISQLLLNRDISARPLSDADRVKVHSYPMFFTLSRTAFIRAQSCLYADFFFFFFLCVIYHLIVLLTLLFT